MEQKTNHQKSLDSMKQYHDGRKDERHDRARQRISEHLKVNYRECIDLANEINIAPEDGSQDGDEEDPAAPALQVDAKQKQFGSFKAPRAA